MIMELVIAGVNSSYEQMWWRVSFQKPLLGHMRLVLVNDPTTSYGIFIENMLDAAA